MAAAGTAMHPVRIGEPSSHSITRPMVVQQAELAAEGILRLRLASPDGKPLPRWTPGSHIDVECGDTGLSRQYSLCGDPAVPGALEIAVLREADLVHAEKAGKSLIYHLKLSVLEDALLGFADTLGIAPSPAAKPLKTSEKTS